jgi:acetyl-CoA decarbonylase/synthase complex subunit gamma
MIATPAMRGLTFTFRERLVLLPVELVMALKPVGIAGVALFIAGYLSAGEAAGLRLLFAFLGAAATGIVVGPLFLPWLPGRSFAIKGALAGLVWCAAFRVSIAGGGMGLPATIAAFVALPAISAFFTLNFTGCTPFTSRSGVKKEMRIGIPAIGCALASGIILLLSGRFL